MADSAGRWEFAKRFANEDRYKRYGRAESCGIAGEDCVVHETGDIGSYSHSDRHLVVWEVMQIIWIAEHFPHPDELISSEEQENKPMASNATDDDKGLIAPLIAFGDFRVQNVTIPRQITWDKSPDLRCSIITRPSEGTNLLDFPWFSLGKL